MRVCAIALFHGRKLQPSWSSKDCCGAILIVSYVDLENAALQSENHSNNALICDRLLADGFVELW
jgi:hypothetical protein